MDEERPPGTSEILQTVLFEWVPKVVVSYELSEQVVPRCWYLHESMVHELLALFQYRQQQQFNTDLGPPPSAPIDFQYQFGAWKARMRELTVNAGCTSADHYEPHVAEWASTQRVDAAQWRIDADAYAASLTDNTEPDESGTEEGTL